MLRLMRLTCALWGLLLFALVLIHAARPAESSQTYRVIYAEHDGICCATFLINERQAAANRVQMGVIPEPLDMNPVSVSGRWRFALVDTPQGVRAYFLPLENGRQIEDGPLIQLPDSEEIAFIQYHQWSAVDDVMMYLALNYSRYVLAYFEVSPDDPEPRRMSHYMFTRVRSLHEQYLPPLGSFSPWVLLILSLNLLVIAGGLKYHLRD